MISLSVVNNHKKVPKHSDLICVGGGGGPVLSVTSFL